MRRLRGSIGLHTERSKVWVRVLYVTGLVVLFLLVTSYLDGAVDFHPSAVMHDPWPILLNALPGVCIAWLLLALVRRPAFSLWLALSLYALLDRINVIKVRSLHTPLLPRDAAFITGLNPASIHLFGEYAGPRARVVLVCMGYVVVTVLLFWLEAPILRNRIRSRLAPLVGLALLFVVIEVGGGWHRLYDANHVTYEPWDPLRTSRQSGVVNTLFAFSLARSRMQYVAKVSVADVRALLDRYRKVLGYPAANSGSGADGPPDIIVVQSESFFDPTVLNGFDHDAWLPYFHAWQARGIGGWMHVPTFGGGTIRTEFEVLTGVTLRAIPHVNFPYLQLPSMQMAGLVSVLDRDGYRTVSIHPNGPDFWDRGSTFHDLGFKQSIWLDDFPAPVEKDGAYTSDKTFTDEIIRILEQPAPGTPKFIFAISIESHGPYQDEPGIDVAERDAISVPPGLPAEDALHLKTYLYHLHDADVELDRLAQVVMAAKRHTILLFYGDHLPPLPTVYKALGFRDGGTMLMEPVPWLLLDNREVPQVASTDVAAWMLPGILLHVAHVGTDGFFHLTRMMPVRLARLTHSPWIKPTQPDPVDAALVKELRNADVQRIRGKFNRSYTNFQDVQVGHYGAPVAVVATALGRYVTSDFRIGGIDTTFVADSPLFARVDLAGDGGNVMVSAQVYAANGGAVLRQARTRMDVIGTDTVNLDLRAGRALPPGAYRVDVRLDGKLEEKRKFHILAPGQPVPSGQP